MQDISGVSVRQTAPIVNDNQPSGLGQKAQVGPTPPAPKPKPPTTPATAPSLIGAIKATGKKGILTTVLVLIVVVYLIWGLMAYSAGPGSGAPKAVPAAFGYFPSASVVLQGNDEAFATWKAGLAALFIGVIALVVMGLSSRLRHKVALPVVALATVVLAVWILPQADHWYTGYNEYVARYSTLKRYNAKQAQAAEQQNSTATTEESLRAQSLQQVIIFRYSEQLAAKHKVTITDADVNKAYKEYATKAGGEAEIQKQLKEYLGWTVAEYKTELRQQLLQEKLNEKLQFVYKGEADAAKQDLKTTKVKSYVQGLEWDAKLRNIQVE